MKSFSSPASPWIQEQGLGLWRPRADWTEKRLLPFIANQHAGRRNMQVRSTGQKDLSSDWVLVSGEGMIPRVRRTAKAMRLIPMLSAMLTSNSSRTGMISDVLTLRQSTQELCPFKWEVHLPGIA